MTPRRFAIAIARLAAALAALAITGCGGEALDATYGRASGASLNGTGAFAAILRGNGHEVRTAVRLTPELEAWADAMVRFAPYPGPPEREEGDWYLKWLQGEGRRLIYVPRDFDARGEYWSAIVARYSDGKQPLLHERARRLRDGFDFAGRPAPRPKEVVDPDDWFAVNRADRPAAACKALTGPWGAGIDAAAAAIPRHETLKVDAEMVLLKGDDAPLVLTWGAYASSGVLVVANGAFLLNAALVNRSRQPLTMRVADWLGPAPLRVAFVEGSSVLKDPPPPPSMFDLLKIFPFGWVAAQLLVLGLAACLARAPRLGRPRAEPTAGDDRPSAHPEALGALLERTGRAADALAILEAYRRWRFPSQRARADPATADRPPLEPFPPIESPANE